MSILCFFILSQAINAEAIASSKANRARINKLSNQFVSVVQEISGVTTMKSVFSSNPMESYTAMLSLIGPPGFAGKGKGTHQFTYDPKKIGKQMQKRGWSDDLINYVLINASKKN
ncbi:hypothetical protein [Paenibacillus sp. UMB4589-SE434]|uniref:hypothetical protein n=1 Tax=Paenibacillus sp. UMB4589-SE434 TaxID=3046314 RepID=UPI00254E60B5|nr:hypothetical protein [Paenibacillus sp. UMB4589-SE434]MDK8181888.1 hypothetical protein [Paenibacillus sp. UMB4589-SE434]